MASGFCIHFFTFRLYIHFYKEIDASFLLKTPRRCCQSHNLLWDADFLLSGLNHYCHWRLRPPTLAASHSSLLPQCQGYCRPHGWGRKWPLETRPGLATVNAQRGKLPSLWASIFKSLSFWTELPGVSDYQWWCQNWCFSFLSHSFWCYFKA